MKKIFYVYTLVFLQVCLFSFPVCAGKSEKEIFFDNVASNWDKSSASAEELSRINEVIGYLGLKEGETVLDAGCGTGRLIPFLHNKVGKNGHVYGIDFSQEMLRIAKQKYPNENISFIKADITQIPLPSESIDRIICFCTFPHIDNKMLALTEFFRVLKSSGILVICNLMGSKELNTLHRKIGGAIANDVSPDVREMKQLFLESNFIPLELQDFQTLYFMMANKPRQ
ncbi:MAG: methyltransferase domain-containing protein [Candidatus Jettenia sp. CY-1]|nr:MAG: methyltransferase domain-containing protein [Candidatus Jettenia sp. CY-1]